MPETAIHAASWLINPDVPPIPGGALLIQDGIISAVGTRKDLQRIHAAQVVEYPGCAILPGLVNAHTHLELTHFPSWLMHSQVDYHPRRYVDWIIQVIKVRRGLALQDSQASIREGMRICLESGTTTVGEIVSDATLLPFYRSSGLFGRLFFELLGQDAARFNPLFEQALNACSADLGGRFSPGLSPHTPFTVGEKYLPLIREAAQARALPLSIHLAESLEETAFIFDSSGPLAEELYPFVGWESYLTPPHHYSSTQLLDRAGLLSPSTLAVHCVHVTRADAEILKQRGVTVVLCPRSNSHLDVGRAPVALLRKLGVPLALGTDSLASNETLSMWDEMRFAMDAFSHELSPEDLFRMATIGGAAALGLARLCGSLEPGKRADFQVAGNAGDQPEKLLERLISEGTVQDVFLAGECFTGMSA